ncbi:hypothetical protein [uncultured Draconibacterium sp.]|nr:hypothetical protein [uncultured Draconibacterium sp.]
MNELLVEDLMLINGGSEESYEDGYEFGYNLGRLLRATKNIISVIEGLL